MVRLVPIALACASLAVGAATLTLAGWTSSTTSLAVAAGALLALLALVGAASAWPQYQLFGPAVLTGSAPHVALTFDDGPHPQSTPALLEALDAAGMRATFFVLADRVEAYPDLARAIAQRHEVALHGASHHPWLTVFGPAKGSAELVDARQRVERITESPSSPWFRPPFGATSPRLFASAARAGLTVVWCSLRTGDGGPITAATLRHRCRDARAGDIVLMHEGPRAAREALPDVLADLQERGLRSITVSEMLG